MPGNARTLRRIEVNYAGVQSSYWVAFCAFSGFVALYLGHLGFTDTQIGFTSALVSGFSILFQLLISSYSDNHSQVPIKRLIAFLHVIAMVLATLLLALPLEVGMALVVYAMAGGVLNSINGLMNAQIMQYINVGIPVQYGWPRGVGSIIYALFALLMGRLIGAYSPAILMPTFLILAAVCIVVVLLMPEVYTLSDQRAAIYVQEKGQQRTTYRDILGRSPAFRLFVVASILLYMGQVGSGLFLVKVVQHVGGGSGELGTAMFIQGGIELPALLLAPRFMKRFKTDDLLVVSLCFYFIKSLLLVIAGNMAGIYIAMATNLLCFGIYCVASVYFVDSLVLPGEKVRAQGLIMLCSSAGGIVSSLLSGVILDAWGLRTLLVLSSAILALALVFTVLCRRANRLHPFDSASEPVVG